MTHAAANPARMAFQYLPLSRLRVFPKPYSPEFKDPEKNADLERSIGSQGIQQPLLVCEIAGDPDHYAVVCGHRRFKAAQARELTDAPVLIQPGLAHGDEASREAIQRLQIEENLHRRQLTAYEQARLIAGYRRDNRLSGSQVANKLGLQRSAVSDLVQIGDFLVALEKKTVGRRTVPGAGRDTPLDCLKTLSRASLLLLAQHKDAPVFDELLARFQRGDSARALRRWLDQRNRARESRTAFVPISKLSSVLFDGQIRVTFKVDVAARLKEGKAGLDAEARRQGRDAMPEMLKSIESAVLAVVPSQAKAPALPAPQDETPKTDPSAAVPETAPKPVDQAPEKPAAAPEPPPEPTDQASEKPAAAPEPLPEPADPPSVKPAAPPAAPAKKKPDPDWTIDGDACVRAMRREWAERDRRRAELKASLHKPTEETMAFWRRAVADLTPRLSLPGFRNAEVVGELDNLVVLVAEDGPKYNTLHFYNLKPLNDYSAEQDGPVYKLEKRSEWDAC